MGISFLVKVDGLLFYSLSAGPDRDGLSSVSINISYRIVIEFIIEGDEILLVNIGKHAPVY